MQDSINLKIKISNLKMTIQNVKSNTGGKQREVTILGVDPGTAIMGWGVINKSQISNFKSQNYGTIRTDSKLPMTERLFVIFTELCDIIEREKPDCVAIEELFFFKNQKTIISVAESRGVAIIASKTHKLPIFEYTPLQVKQALTGYGRADKNQIQQMVKAHLGLKEIPRPDDASDALAVAICHSQTNNNLKSQKSNLKILE